MSQIILTERDAVNTYVYDPYGNHLSGTTETIADPWQFAGGFRDSFSGYYKFGTRYYDPTIGRWTQPDPSGMEANSYAYAAGNPVNFVDPYGEFAFAIPAGIAAYKGFLWAAGSATALIAAGAAGEKTPYYWSKVKNTGKNYPNRNAAVKQAKRDERNIPNSKYRPECDKGGRVHLDICNSKGELKVKRHYRYPE